MMQKIDLEKKIGPLRLRSWGLILNLVGNVIALYGLAAFLKTGGGQIPLVLGSLMTVTIILILSKPAE